MQRTYQMQISLNSLNDYTPNTDEVARLIENAIKNDCEKLNDDDLARNTIAKVYSDLIEDITQEGEIPIR